MILEVLSSPIVSGITGILGGWLSKRQELKAIELKNSHDLAMITARTDAAVTIKQAEVDEAKIMGALKVEHEEVKAFTYSQKASDFLKPFVRPIILFLVGYMCYRNMMAVEYIVGGIDGLDPVELTSLYKEIVRTCFAMFTMGFGWYFGQRVSKVTERLMG